MINKLERGKRTHPFTTIDTRPLEDERLSWKARGILAYLLSKPDHWEVQIADLMNRGTDGRDAVRSGLQELREHGYAEVVTKQDRSGKFEGKHWIIHELPLDRLPTSAKSVGRETRNTENPTHSHIEEKERLKATPRSGRGQPVGFGLNGESTNDCAKLVKLFADWTVENKLYIGMEGSSHGGWRARTIRKWQRNLRQLLDEVSYDTLRDTMEWYFDHYDDEYMPRACTIPGFIKKYGKIKDAMTRKDTKRNGRVQEDDVHVPKIVSIGRRQRDEE